MTTLLLLYTKQNSVGQMYNPLSSQRSNLIIFRFLLMIRKTSPEIGFASKLGLSQPSAWSVISSNFLQLGSCGKCLMSRLGWPLYIRIVEMKSSETAGSGRIRICHFKMTAERPVTGQESLEIPLERRFCRSPFWGRCFEATAVSIFFWVFCNYRT